MSCFLDYYNWKSKNGMKKRELIISLFIGRILPSVSSWFSIFLILLFPGLKGNAFIKLHGNLVNVCNIVYKGGGSIGQELGIYNDEGLDKDAIKRGLRNGVDIYRNIWKSMLIWKRDKEVY